MKILYFNLTHAIEVHDVIIDNSGGRKGIVNEGLVKSVIEHIQHDIYYPTFESKLTHLFFSINKNHSFVDGNKRSSIALCAYFMEINGYEYRIDLFIKEMENI